METNRFWEVPEKLGEIGNILCMESAERISAVNEKVRAHYTDAPKTDYLDAQLESMKHLEYSIAVTSGQSCGKSTMFNAMLGYPLLPAAQTVTTTCAVEIRYGEELAVKVVYVKGEDKKKTEKMIYATRKIDSSLWKRLKEYACLCVNESVISAETLQYFSDKDIDRNNIMEQDLELSAGNPEHVMVLYLILFGTYVGQNDVNEKSAEGRKIVCRYRAQLLKEFKVPQDIDYSLVVFWKQEALKKGLVLMDLPGLGSIAKAAGNKKAHNQITMDYMLKADTVFMMFDPLVLAGDMPEVLKILIESEKMKYVVTKENRIIPILNRVDKATSIPSSINAVRALFGDLQTPYVYPVAALWGEHQFVESGLFPFRRTLMYKWNVKNQREMLENMGMEIQEEQIENALRKKLEKNYYNANAFEGLDGKEYQINLAEFIKLFTEDYVDRMRCLKGLELLNAGSGAYRLILSDLQGRAHLMAILQKGGSRLAESVVDALENAIQGGIKRFNGKFEEMQEELFKKFEEAEKEEVLPVKKSYQRVLQQIEKDIASLIRSSVKSMEKNWLGDIIIDVNNEKARKNLKKYEELLKALQNFSVSSRLDAPGKQLTQLIAKVVQLYEDKKAELEEHYKMLPEIIKAELEEGYEQAVEDILRENAGLTREEFDRFYAEIFRGLIQVVNTQTEIFSMEGITKLQNDERIKVRQTEVIDRIAMFSTKMEDVYHDLCKIYIEGGKEETIFTGHNLFNGARIMASVDVPFFPEDKRDELVEDITQTFQEYADGMDDDVNDIRYMLTIYNQNSLGSNGSIQGMTSFIRQNFGSGELEIQAQIDDIRHWMNYIKRNIDELMKEIAPALETAAGCSWAKDEADVVREKFDMLREIAV